MAQIPYGRQYIERADREAVAAALKADLITQGPMIGSFEKHLARRCGARYAVAVSSGTAGLHIAALAAGLVPGDEAITTPITFLATANAIVYTGARPVFADIDPVTANLDPRQVAAKVTRKTCAILPVDLTGLPADLEAIHRIARRYKLTVIEDACHALGATYKKTRIGSCRYTDMTVLSFHPVKAITTGEGGAVLTNRKDLYDRLRRLRNHGITKDHKAFRNRGLGFDPDGRPNPWYYEMQELGFNYRITDIQASLGISQLTKLRRFIARRRQIASCYDRAFKDIELMRLPSAGTDMRSAWHLDVVRIDFDRLGKTRARVMAQLKRQGVMTQVHYIPVFMQPYYAGRFRCDSSDCPQAQAYYREALSLPIYPAMTDKDIKRVITAVQTVLR